MYQYRLRTLFAWIWVLAVVVTFLSWLLGAHLPDVGAGIYAAICRGFGVEVPKATDVSGLFLAGLVIGFVVFCLIWAIGITAGVHVTIRVFRIIKGDD
jgi:hypothetical protein